MAYNYTGPYSFRNGIFNSVIGAVLDFDDLLPIVAGGLDGSNVAAVAIGNEIAVGVGITATLGDVWDGKSVRLNLAAFGLSVGPQNNNYWRAAVPPVASGGVFFPAVYVGNNAVLHQKIGVYVFRAGPDDLGVLFVLKVTADLLEEVKGQNITNYDRFLKSALLSTAGLLRNSAASAYKPTGPAALTIRVDVHDGETDQFYLAARNPADLNNFLKMPVEASFYEAFPAGAAGRYISEITSTTPGQIAAGLPPTVAAVKTVNSAYVDLDPQYTTAAASLSPLEVNTVTVKLAGPSFPGAVVNDPLTTVRAILIRTDNIQNNQYFFTDYEGAEGVIPVSDPSVSVIAGAIETPAAWSENLALQTTEITFNVNGVALSPGGDYRIIINSYDNASGRVYSHISPPLVANYVLPIAPPLTSSLGEYCEEYGSDADLLLAPGGRVKCCLNIDITGYNAALAAAGYGGNFIFTVRSVFASLPPVSPVVGGAETEGVIFGITNTLTENASLEIDPTAAKVCAVFRISPARAATSFPVLWEIKINQDNGLGGFEEVTIRYNQYLTIKDFDDDPADTLIETRFYRSDNYPATKTPISNICEVSEFIVEVEKQPTAPDGETVVMIYPVPTPGPAAIEEEASFAPVYLPALTSPKLAAVSPWAGDFTSYLVNTAGLVLDGCYNVITLLRQKIDYCGLLPSPIPAVSGTIDTISSGINWRILTDLTPLYNYALSIDPAAVVSVHQMEDPITGLLIGTPLIWGNPSSSNTQIYIVLPVATTAARLRYDITLTYDAGSGPHNILLSLNYIVNGPPPAGPWITDPAPAAICDDLNI